MCILKYDGNFEATFRFKFNVSVGAKPTVWLFRKPEGGKVWQDIGSTVSSGTYTSSNDDGDPQATTDGRRTTNETGRHRNDGFQCWWLVERF